MMLNFIDVGLQCAALLIEKGVKVTIVEARDRIGGRVGLSSLMKARIPNDLIRFIKLTI